MSGNSGRQDVTAPAKPPALLPVDDSTAQINKAFPSKRDDFRGTVIVLLLAAALIGVIVLLGWTFHVESMKRIAKGLTSMNPVTAICFEACCLVLWLLKDARPTTGNKKLIVNVLPLLPLYVGLSKLTDLAFGTSLCPDALLFTSQLDFGQAFPSRMAPNVALSFVLLSIIQLVVDRPRLPSFMHPQWLITFVMSAALAALVGYGYDTSGFYKYKQYIPMALHSACCFMLIAFAVILSRPDQGYLQLIPRGSPGARSYSRLLPACVLIPALLGGIQLYGGENGWFIGHGTGAALAAVVTIIAMSVLAFINSVTLNRTESVRRLAEAQLKQMVSELDQRNQALHTEVAERERLERKAAHQATHDALTGLPNRLLFLDRLQLAIARTARGGNSFALFYVDVDKFKPVNDRYGHQAGDALLQQLAQRLKQTIREVDTAARLGGDEFAAILEAPISNEHALQLAERLTTAVGQSYQIDVVEQGRLTAVDVNIGISVGVALFPQHASNLDGLISIADRAMYSAKRHGKESGQSRNIELASLH